MKKLKIPEKTIERLPLYLRRSEKLHAMGENSVTSQKFVRDLPGINSDNLRKDLSYFGNYGKKGNGYDMSRLIKELRNILKLNKETHVALVGAGNLGTALLTHQDFNRWGFRITVAFDNRPKVIGNQIGGILVEPIQDLESTVRKKKIEAGMIAVPADSAQSVSDSLTSAGIKGILNFAPTLLDVPDEVKVKQVDITSTLKELNYYLQE
ncbi:redox-sensing transcriptional repressor Rex [Candidatus Bipolaricaulota bacterium]|nr:redox-sensing transcriptional repressor Rex [Candidatus Bipolaricaulota bacterium]